MRKSLIVLVVLEALAAVQIAYYYPKLPAVVASHFNASGVANAWQPKQLFFETYAIVLLAIAAIYFVLPRLLFALPPEFVNLPNKEYWFAPARRASTLEYLVDHLCLFGAATLGLLILIFQFGFQANVASEPVFPNTVAALLAAFYGIFVVLWLLLVVARFRRVRG